MSSCPTAPTSTTGSSSNCSSRGASSRGSASLRRGDQRSPGGMAVIACGALGSHVREITERRGWDVSVHTLPAQLHNTPRQITPAAERLAGQLRADGLRVVLAYADCGTYGELDRLCD